MVAGTVDVGPKQDPGRLLAEPLGLQAPKPTTEAVEGRLDRSRGCHRAHRDPSSPVGFLGEIPGSIDKGQRVAQAG